MIGTTFKPSNEYAFWDCLIPDTITQMYVRLKLAAYEYREERLNEYVEIQTLPNFEPYKLQDF